MDFNELAWRRRSVRNFEGKPVPHEVIERIIRTTLTAPSSKNLRTTRIAYTDDCEIIAKVAAMRSFGSAFVAQAPLVFFVMGDESQTDLWRENCAISATYMQLAAEAEGLGSCWVQVFGRPHNDDDPDGTTAEQFLHATIPHLPGFRIMCAVAVGYPEVEARQRKEKDDSDKVFRI